MVWGSGFGNELGYRDPKSGSLTGDYVPVDFKKHAQSMGAYAVSAQTAAEVTAAVQEARRRPGVSVVWVRVDHEKRMPSLGTWWDVPVAEVSVMTETCETRAHYAHPTQSQLH